MESTATQDGGASGPHPTTNALPADQFSVAGESSSERPPSAPGELDAAQPGQTATSSAAKSDSNCNAVNAAIMPGNGKATASCNDFMSDDEWEALYRSGTQDAGFDRLIGFSEKAADIKTCTTAAEGAPSPTTTTKSDSAIAPPTSNTCPETAPEGPSADLSPTNSGSTRTPDLTPGLTRTETSPARSTSSALYTPPAIVAPAQPSYDDGQSTVVGRGFPDALLEEFAAGLSPDARQLAAAIAAQVGVPGDTLLTALLHQGPSVVSDKHQKLNAGPNGGAEKALPAGERRPAFEDARPAQHGSDIAAQVYGNADRNERALPLVPTLRMLKRGRDDDEEKETVHKRAKESRGAQQEEAPQQRYVNTPSPPGDAFENLNEATKTFHSDSDQHVPPPEPILSATAQIDAQLAHTAVSDDGLPKNNGWEEWDDALAGIDVEDEDSIPHTGARHASNVSLQQQQQGAAQSSVAAPTGLGQRAQGNNKVKSPLGRAIESFAADAERLLVEAEIATRILVRPHAVHPPEPKKVAASVKEDLRILLGAYPGSTFASTICNVCFAEGAHGDRKCEEQLEACRVCACPVTRGDLQQFSRHRINKCPIWRALVATGRHNDWLAATGLLHIEEPQFFGRNIRNGAPKNDDKKRKQVLLDSLKIKELPEIGKKMTAENPFAGMPGLTTKVFERLLEDATAEARSSEASAES
ncbi:hypothetical protein AURDEDRAFT_159277 [Auricularia subglabra TFB-10046 SS5]|nr:hypothetical protein AURDEDRAFT_159277 [Auricularia subglabra TFB-10046 SS5]